MANVIDDQERVRQIQTSLFAQFERKLLDNTLPPDDSDIEKNVLFYILDAIKRNVSKSLERIETVCRFRIMFGKPENAVTSLQCMYDLLDMIDVDFTNDLIQRDNEKKKKNQKGEE